MKNLDNLLFDAIEENDLVLINALIRDGADVNAKRYNKTTLMTAIINNNLASVKAILDTKKYNFKNTDSEGNNALAIACSKASFLRYRKSVDDFAIIGIIRLLLAAGENVNYQNFNGDTPLILATINENYEVVEMLLDANADVNKINKSGYNALKVAALYENKELQRLLMRYFLKIV
jgi:ankyrin repeat protein